ncbi:hypothetical protein ACFPRL_25005 [Pseudoclavibacter helvolus]
MAVEATGVAYSCALSCSFFTVSTFARFWARQGARTEKSYPVSFAGSSGTPIASGGSSRGKHHRDDDDGREWHDCQTERARREPDRNLARERRERIRLTWFRSRPRGNNAGDEREGEPGEQTAWE